MRKLYSILERFFTHSFATMKTKSREGSGFRDGFLFKYCLSCISASVAECGRFFVNKLIMHIKSNTNEYN